MQMSDRIKPDWLLVSEQGQKMMAGEVYFSSEKHLSGIRMQTKQLCFDYNHCSPADHKQKRLLLKQLLPNAKGIWIEPTFYCDYGLNIYAQNQVFINHNVTILDGAKITLGDNVLIGPNCVLSATSHPSDLEQRTKGKCVSLAINIGNGAWLGANVTVLAGVNIGAGAIIGAGVVVRKDVPEHTVLKVNN